MSPRRYAPLLPIYESVEAPIYFEEAFAPLTPPDAPRPERVEPNPRDHQSAYEQGFKDGAARAEEELARTLAAWKEFEASSRRRWIEREATTCATRIAACMNDLRTRVAADIARALLPLVKDSIRRRAMDALLAVLSEQDWVAGQRIQISASREMIDTLRPSLEELGVDHEFIESERDEIEARIGQTRVKTSFAGWDKVLAAIEGQDG